MDKRWLCVNLPAWPIDRARRRSGRAGKQSEHNSTPAAKGRHAEPRLQSAGLLFAERCGKQDVVMGCAAAVVQGVRPGMTVAQATALLRGPVWLQPHQPEQDSASLQALARWCLRFTPRVMDPRPRNPRNPRNPQKPRNPRVGRDGSVHSDHHLILDMTGCDRLYRGPHRMVEAVVQALHQLGLNVRAALAPTRVGAEALARADRSAICLVRTTNELHHRLDVLPVEALGLEPGEVEGLNEVGIDRVEQLRAVPRDELIARFGPGGFGPGVLRRLDLAWGDLPCQDIEVLRRWEPPRVEVRFAGPTTQFEAVQEATCGLCAQLAERLQNRLRAAGTLTLEVERLDETLRAQWVSQTLTLSRPSRDGKHLWTLLRPHVERLHLGHGIETLTLTARQAPRVGHTQFGPPQAVQQDAGQVAAEAQLVDVLSARLGAHRVTRPCAVPTHVPEAAVRWVPAVEAESRGNGFDPRDPAWCGENTFAEAANTEAEAGDGYVITSGGTSGGGGRPSWLLDPMESARVVLMNPEGPVLSLNWRGCSHQLIHSIGPERIAPRWWKSPAQRVVAPAAASGVDPASNRSNITSVRPRKVDVLVQANPESIAQAGDTKTACETEPLPPLWSDLAARDYYRVQDESGQWLWIFRRLDTGRWFVHGLWL